MFSFEDIKKGKKNLKKSETKEITRLDQLKSQGDFEINIIPTNSSEKILEKNSKPKSPPNVSFTTPKLSEAPIAPSIFTNEPFPNQKKKKNWKVELPGTIMNPNIIQTDPSIDKYPKHEYPKIKIMIVQR